MESVNAQTKFGFDTISNRTDAAITSVNELCITGLMMMIM